MRLIYYFITLSLLSISVIPAFGQTAYGFMMGDRQGRYGFVHFDVNDPGSVVLDRRTSSLSDFISAAEQVGEASST